MSLGIHYKLAKPSNWFESPKLANLSLYKICIKFGQSLGGLYQVYTKLRLEPVFFLGKKTGSKKAKLLINFFVLNKLRANLP